MRARLNSKIVAGGLIVVAFVLVALIGPYLAPADPSAPSAQVLLGPSTSHLLGTTSSGQDVLSEMLVGTQQSILVGFVAAAIGEALAIAIGVAAGFLGGAADEALSGIINLFLVLPVLPLEVILASYLSREGWFGITVIIAVTAWPFGARMLRAQTIAVRRRDFVEAARLAGDSRSRIVFAEIVPNLIAIIASGFLFQVIFAIIVQTGLAFLGIAGTSMWSWGTILYWAQTNNALLSGAWWWFVPPGLALGILGLGLALINLGIDETMNPRLAGTRRAARRERQTAIEPEMAASSFAPRKDTKVGA